MHQNTKQKLPEGYTKEDILEIEASREPSIEELIDNLEYALEQNDKLSAENEQLKELNKTFNASDRAAEIYKLNQAKANLDYQVKNLHQFINRKNKTIEHDGKILNGIGKVLGEKDSSKFVGLIKRLINAQKIEA